MPRYTDQDLLAAAGDCFRRYGYFKARMEGIATRVPCSKVTLYRYFPDKVSLAQAWLESKMTASRLRVDAVISDRQPFELKVARLIHCKQEDLSEFGEPFFRDLVSPACPETLTHLMHRQATLNKQQTLSLIASGRETGDVHANVSDALIQVLLDHFELLFTNPAFLDLVPENRRIETLVGLLLHGLALTPRSGEANHD